MLNNVRDIKTIRDLCRRLKIKTISRSLGVLNKELATFNPHYRVKVVRVSKKTLDTPARLVLHAVDKNGVAITSDKFLILPCSWEQFVQNVTIIDAQAHSRLNMGYGNRGVEARVA